MQCISEVKCEAMSYTNLPSMQTLLVFQAAARHLSFTKAGQELNLTQTAVSHQIKNLENILGVKLFVRKRNSLTLTTAAQDYLASITQAINIVSSATNNTKHSQSSTTLSIVCLPTYAVQCLIPILPEFQRLHPEISLQLRVSSDFSEFEGANYDVAIRYGSGSWQAFRSDLLHVEEFFPVCSPQLIPGRKASEIELLNQLPKIRTYFYSMFQDDWAAWLEAAGHTGVSFSNTSVFHMHLASLEAANAGCGLAIGRTPLVDRYLANGSIVAPFRTRAKSRSAYYLTSPAGKEELPNIKQFREWILARVHNTVTATERLPWTPVSLSADRPASVDHGYRPLAASLSAWGSRFPDKYALVDVVKDRHITFSELNHLVDSCARHLYARGVQRGDRVILFMKDGLEKIVVWFAVWRLAAVVCPIDLTRFRPLLAEKLVHTLQSRRILCDDLVDLTRVPLSLRERILRVSPLERDGEATWAYDVDFHESADMTVELPEGADSGDVATICSTSGTTGEPKLVVNDHLAYWFNGKGVVENLSLRAEDRLLEYRSFDWSSAQILSLMSFLHTGLTLHVAPRFSRSSFADWLSRHQISVSVGVPAVTNLLLRDPDDRLVRALADLRFMTSSTSPLPTSQWLRFEQTYRVRLLNLYGSTEAGWICGNRSDDIQVGTVGYPMPGVSIDIVDEDGRTCAAGVPGQVMVRSPALALGILTADGSMEKIRGRRLPTRDIGVLDKSGRVRITGRTDDLIVRGGVKIHPAHIEEALLAHPEVLDAGVIGVPHEIYGEAPVAFVLLRTGFSGHDLQAYCLRNLPREEVPHAIIPMASLPRNARGKLARAALLEAWKSGA